MNKTVYVKDADAPIWDRAAELSNGNLSALIASLLAQWIKGKRSPAEIIADQTEQIAELRSRVEKLEKGILR